MGVHIKNWSLADWKELLKWAKIGANNAMIGEFTEVEEIPPHGRLIDAAALMREMHNVILEDGEDRRTFYSVIERQPTIIPASEEGRVMAFRVIDKKTGKEADTWEIALKEDWAKRLCYCDMEGFAIEEDGTLLLLDECGRFEYCPEGRFEIVQEEGE